MTIVEQIEKDLVGAMKAKEELKLSVLRMAKAALMNKKVELGKPLRDPEALAVLRTLIKQRGDSAEQFRKVFNHSLERITGKKLYDPTVREA